MKPLTKLGADALMKLAATPEEMARAMMGPGRGGNERLYNRRIVDPYGARAPLATPEQQRLYAQLMQQPPAPASRQPPSAYRVDPSEFAYLNEGPSRRDFAERALRSAEKGQILSHADPSASPYGLRPSDVPKHNPFMHPAAPAAGAAHAAPAAAAAAAGAGAKPGFMARLRGMFGKKASAKYAFSVTPEGHEQDAATYRALADYYDMNQDASRDYAKKARIRHLLTLAPLANIADELAKRHYAYSADRHEDEENAYNPVGGLLTPYRRKEAFAVTDEGHEYDERVNRAAADTLHRIQQANAKYRDAAPVRGMLATDPMTELAIEFAKRHAAYTAKKHSKGENAYNPFGGFATDYPEE